MFKRSSPKIELHHVQIKGNRVADKLANIGADASWEEPLASNWTEVESGEINKELGRLIAEVRMEHDS